jgi:hypothetical protein
VRKSEPNRVNRKRKRETFIRCYESLDRVLFIKALPCVVSGCPNQPCDNMHIQGDGAGRKADSTFVVPGCTVHHHLLDDELGRTKFEQLYHVNLAVEAIDTELKWRQHVTHLDGGSGLTF